jgi:hypothetical protein
LITHKTFRLTGRASYQDGIRAAKVSGELELQPDPEHNGGYVLAERGKLPIGRISSRHWVSRDLASGRQLLHATINCVQPWEHDASITVRIVTGDAGDVYERILRPEVRSKGPYSVNISGESFRQSEIARTSVGDSVRFIHDVTNVHDRRAIMVLTERGDHIGFLPKDGWLTRAILDEERAWEAKVLAIHRSLAGRSTSAVVLSVALT